MPDYSNMSTDPSAMMAMMGPFLIVMLLFYLFWIFLWWRIFSKAGYSGALALLHLAVIIPFIGWLVPLVLTAWFAFTTWPVQKQAGGGAGPVAR